MKRYNIIVTGVSAPVGYGVVRSLRASSRDARIIGVDIYEDAVGRMWCDNFECGVRADSDSYLDFLESIIRKYDADLVIPTVELETEVLAVNREAVDALGATFVLNRPELIKLFGDKWKTHLFLKESGLSTIPTLIDGSFEDISSSLGLPFLIKPRSGYGGQGIRIIESGELFDYWKKKAGDAFMAQKKMQGEEGEFTVSIFGLGDGTYVNFISMKKELSKKGYTVRGESVFDEAIVEFVRTLCNLARPLGPTNIQLIKEGGLYYLLEVNPRISASTSLRALFGCNESEMSIEFFLEGKTPAEREITTGVAVRYEEDILL